MVGSTALKASFVNRSDLKSLRQELEYLRAELQDDICARLEVVTGRQIAAGAKVDLAEWRALSSKGSGQELEALFKDLERVEAALLRMADGSYGTCPECGEEIELNRLRGDPAALFCIACVGQLQRKVAQS